MADNHQNYYRKIANLNQSQVEQQRAKWQRRRRNRLIKGKNMSMKMAVHAILIFYAMISLFPFFWSLIVSFKSPYLIVVSGVNPFPRAGEWTLENYNNLFNGAAQNYISTWAANTVVYATLSALLNATLNLLAGYALANIAMRGKRLVISYFLASILVPSQATFLPTFFIYSKLGIIGDISRSIFLMAVIFSGMANIVLTFMARQFFITQSRELEEYAAIEGYGPARIFMKITLRKMLPLFATQFVLVFMGAWNNFLLFTLFAVGDPEKMTIYAGITSITSKMIDRDVGYGQLIATSNLTFIPMIAIYVISLRIQIRGIKGGNK